MGARQREKRALRMEPPLYSWQRGEPVSNGRGFFWEAAEVVVPAGAVKASDRMYVVRSPAGDVGKFIANEGTAKFPAHGKERTLSDFEFLVLASGAEAVWLLGVPSLDDCVWASERMVVIRATDHPDRDPGKFIADENAAKIPRNGKEVTLQPEDYEHLVVRRQNRLYPALAAPAYSWQNPNYPPSSGLYSWQPGEPCSRSSSPGASASEGLLVPARALKASERCFIVRSAAGDVGKFVTDDEGEGVATFGLNGQERTLEAFEFLVLAEGAAPFWAQGATEPHPPRDEWVWASERMAVIRATDHADRDPGKFIADETAAKIPRGGREVTLRPEDFELLTVRRAGQLRGTTPPSPPPGYSTSPPSRGFFGSLFGGDSHGGGAGAAGGATAAGSTGAAGAGVAGAMGAAGAAAHALAERGEKLSNLEDATQQMSLEAESFASMAAQLKEREQNRGLFPWS